MDGFAILSTRKHPRVKLIENGCHPLYFNSMNRCIQYALALTFVASSVQAAEDGFVSIFDGKTLNGWHVSAKSGHSRASKNTTGGDWKVVDGAITGSQDIPGNGGIVLTDAKYSEFEIILEMNNDFGPDSGLFLRCTEEGKCYQGHIDFN